MEGINSSIQRALKAERMFPRPHGGPGLWVSFLLPLAVIVGGWRTPESSATYLSCALYSFNTFLNLLLLLFHIFKYKSTHVSKGINILCAIPCAISIFLSSELLKLG